MNTYNTCYSNLYSIRKLTAVLVILSLFFPLGCRESHVLKDFTSDGCSLFPDSSVILEKDWCACCFEHDKMYWQGGTEQDRLDTDIIFRDCILEKTGDETLSEIMYKGVRFGGSPYFFNWYRWGYGWDYDRKYVELTTDEKKLIKFKLNKYNSNNPSSPCRN